MHELSVGILTIGSAQLPHAIRSVEAQTQPVEHIVVENFVPYSKAFNHLISHATTRYVICLDEDVELDSDACEYMLQRMQSLSALDDSLTQLLFRLWDPLLGKVLAGVRLLHVERLREMPMPSSLCPDRDMTDGLTEAGWKTVVDEERTVGTHARNRNDYELFIKNAVTASKAFARGIDKARWTDVDRVLKLMHVARELPRERAFALMGGVYWGLFHPISTNASEYPKDMWEKLLDVGKSLEEGETVQRIAATTARIDERISLLARNVDEPGYYSKERYFSTTYQRTLLRIATSETRFWDCLGLGQAELAVALSEMGLLRRVFTEETSQRRLKNPVTQALVENLHLTRLTDDAGHSRGDDEGGLAVDDSGDVAGNAKEADPAACGLLLASPLKLQPATVRNLIERYETVALYKRPLDVSGIDPDTLVKELLAGPCWTIDHDDRHTTFLSRMSA